MKAKILLIEDSEAQGKRIVDLLEQRGYEAHWARTGMEGLKQARTKRPDLIVLDVVMEDMDGLAVCRWLKVSGETRDIPIIMLTVRDGVEHRVEGLNVGANDYLAKPFVDEELEARIFASLRLKMAQAELQLRNSQLESMLHHVEALAITDPLTGLFNRRRFSDVLKREFALTRRYKNALSCVLLDLDHFKQINDRFGHDAGDAVLKETARKLGQSVREVDLAARYGGEEFVILMPHTEKRDAVVVAERILKFVRQMRFEFAGTTVTLTASLGLADVSDVTGDNPEDLVKCADVAMYRAKEAGRDRIVLYEAEIVRLEQAEAEALGTGTGPT